MLEELLKEISAHAALVVEIIAVVVVGYGAAEALVRSLPAFFWGVRNFSARRAVFLDFGRWLVLGLQFALAADIIHTAIAPNWSDIGQLAAIAAIRTSLNYFLERDLEKYSESEIKVASAPTSEKG